MIEQVKSVLSEFGDVEISQIGMDHYLKVLSPAGYSWTWVLQLPFGQRVPAELNEIFAQYLVDLRKQAERTFELLSKIKNREDAKSAIDNPQSKI